MGRKKARRAGRAEQCGQQGRKVGGSGGTGRGGAEYGASGGEKRRYVGPGGEMRAQKSVHRKVLHTLLNMQVRKHKGRAPALGGRTAFREWGGRARFGPGGAVLPRGAAAYFSSHTISAAMSAGETPLMRLAWPRFSGRTAFSF